MTPEQLEATLPSGFRDARLRRVEVDYGERRARLDLVLDAGDPGADGIGDREAWRPAHLLVFGLLFVALDPPHTRREAYAGEARITRSGPATAAQRDRLPALPTGAFCHALYAANWDAWVFVAGGDARLELA